MKILSLDTSAKTASTAVVVDGKLISQCFTNCGLTHSKTLMSMVDNVLNQAGYKLNEIDAIAVNNGPGSFTGIRIGVSTAKGLAFSGNIKVSGVSTLNSIAYNYNDENCYICAAMDARCNQVYYSWFKSENGTIERISNDTADCVDNIFNNVNIPNDANIIFAGDGSELCYNRHHEQYTFSKICNDLRKYQLAYGVALTAINTNSFISGEDLVPVYLRPSQAERELKNNKGE